MPRSDDYVLAIDLGTSALKLALVSTHGELADAEQEPMEVTLVHGGGAEQDPEDWWSAIRRTTGRLLDRRSVPVERIVAVNSSVQWSGTVAVGEDGAPLANAVIWMDSRGADQARRVTGGFPKVEGYGLGRLLRWIHRTGGVPTHSGKDSIAHILWIKEEWPDVYRRTATFLEPKDWLNLRLTGRKVASFDSITLHWVADTRDVSSVRYDAGLIRMAGIDRSKLPELVPPASIIGTLTEGAARDLGLSTNVKVVSGTPDIFAAAIGSGAVRDFDAHLCIGTSSWLACHVPYKKSDLFHNMASLPSAIPGRYLLANEQESAGACLTWLRDNVLYPADELRAAEAPPDLFAAFDRMAGGVAPGADGLLFLPWLNGERSPVDDRAVRGGFFNQTLETTRAHMVRAVLEGVAFNSRWLLTYVETFIKQPLDAVTMIGGGAKSSLWCQIHADVLNRPIHQVKDPVYANARGAALLAGLALGALTVDDIPGKVRIAATYLPEPDNRSLYDGLFVEFVEVYRSTKKIYARLNALHRVREPAPAGPEEA
jgi:xylulokinase